MGRAPRQSIKRNQVIALKYASYGQTKISANAKKSRAFCIGGSPGDGTERTGYHHRKNIIPKVLALTGTLNYMAANLNQIAKKRNSEIA
jgi:hypothetical protein